MCKILFIFGTRPELIKIFPLIKLLKDNTIFKVLLCNTGQHKEMLDALLTDFHLTPDFNLFLMQPNQSLPLLSARLLEKLQPIIQEVVPDLVVVQGDTTTAFIGALAASYEKIPVAHIEAGLRTGDYHKPFPEERNRVLISKLSDYHFAPTMINKNHLIEEGIDPDTIHVTGNTVIDAIQWVAKDLKWQESWKQCFDNASDHVRDETQKMVLITGHRRESFGSGFSNICMAIKALAIQNPQVHFIYPVHLNPNVEAPVYKILSDIVNVHLIAPLDYFPFVYLMKRCHFILTDSGGIQEEAPSLGKPVLVMRDKTERTEAIDAGTAELVGTEIQKIINSASTLLNDSVFYEKMARAQNPYGDGQASGRIIEILKKVLLKSTEKHNAVAL